MANSQWAYVRSFENPHTLLPNTYIVIRIDGHGFHNFTAAHNYQKPNDERGLGLMNRAANHVMASLQDIVLAYGQSDEYSFLFRQSTNLYKRREEKLVSTVVSLFTSAFVFYWDEYFGGVKLQYPPSFDGRAILYPTVKNVRDYFSWRQADCHINNLYNTCFWALVLDPHSPRTEKQAQLELKDTVSADKNELLFSKYGINYNNLPEMFRKGSVLYFRKVDSTEVTKEGKSVVRSRNTVVTEHRDIIGDSFWKETDVLVEDS